MNTHGGFDYSKVTIYLVGGFVRDHFMGRTPKDKDYLVVGSSPEEMLSLGFILVGASFPVFLHPETGDEYALARTERKSGTGYKGFECDWEDVTLEEDLSRRDLTINAIAWDCSRHLGKVYDPFNGRQDIKDKILRPVSPAFKEDPCRVLRVARFLARYGDQWEIHESTTAMMDSVYHSGELMNLTPERVFLEMKKALTEETPSLFFTTLYRYSIFKEVDILYGVPQKEVHHPEVEEGLEKLWVK
jgi:tRNA nucleotidyltransferase (CCA-adding enzyme)